MVISHSSDKQNRNTSFRSNGRMALFVPAVFTVMEGRRTSLQKWFIAFYHLSQPHSINAFQLKEEIHVTCKNDRPISMNFAFGSIRYGKRLPLLQALLGHARSMSRFCIGIWFKGEREAFLKFHKRS
jgi:hypothetical protein